jgi:translation elongation factor EF-4
MLIAAREPRKNRGKAILGKKWRVCSKRQIKVKIAGVCHESIVANATLKAIRR